MAKPLISPDPCVSACEFRPEWLWIPSSIETIDKSVYDACDGGIRLEVELRVLESLDLASVHHYNECAFFPRLG
jgi:hypothetical protein